MRSLLYIAIGLATFAGYRIGSAVTERVMYRECRMSWRTVYDAPAAWDACTAMFGNRMEPDIMDEIDD